MKKLILGLFLVTATIMIIISCNKSEVITQTPTTTNELSFRLIENPLPISDYLVNTEGEDDEKISKQLLEIGLVARDLFTDNFYNETVISEAKQHDNDCTDLRKFIASARAIDRQKNVEILNKLEELVVNADLTRRITNHKSGGDDEEDYIPALFVVNAETADFTEMPIVSPGVYVDASLPESEEYDEYIVAWYPNEDGTFSEILINEEMAMNTTNPIFIVDNAEEDTTNGERTAAPQAPELEQEITLKNPETAWYCSNEFQINHRYENIGRSEFCITGGHITENAEFRQLCRRDNDTYTSWKKIREVRSEDIGKQLSHWEQFCDNDVLPFNNNFVFWNTFERDWAKSKKDLGEATGYGLTFNLRGNMRYSGDWYAHDPDDLDYNPVDFGNIYSTWLNWHENTKTRFAIWRVQP